MRETHTLRTTLSGGLMVIRKKENMEKWRQASAGGQEVISGRTCAHTQPLREEAGQGGRHFCWWRECPRQQKVLGWLWEARKGTQEVS